MPVHHLTCALEACLGVLSTTAKELSQTIPVKLSIQDVRNSFAPLVSQYETTIQVAEALLKAMSLQAPALPAAPWVPQVLRGEKDKA